MDTIFAVSSGAPPAAIAVLRVSGPDAAAAVTRLAGPLPASRRAGLRALRDAGGALLDRALVLRFPAPDTATGEDLVELHCHGGRAVVAAVEAALAAMPGLRRAAPGEFTRRALANGRIDLAEAEGLGDLLAAQTERQRVAAISATEGLVSRAVRGWMDDVALLSARTEALIDFSDEDDVGSDVAGEQALLADIAALGAAMQAAVALPPVDRLTDGLRVVIAGSPNTGKSTLINLLGEREAAIVSPIAGTTRDRIEVAVIRAGIAYVLTDTAGLAVDSDDPIEAIGIARAEEAMAAADIVVWTTDAPPVRGDAIWLHTRADVRGAPVDPRQIVVSRDDPGSILALWAAIAARGEACLPRADAVPFRREQQAAIAQAAAWLCGIDTRDLLIVAEHLRSARTILAQLLGYDATEAMLDALFGRFCIGK